MANARKCNRCGKCFDPLNIEGMTCRFQNPIFQTAEDIRNMKVGKRIVDDGPDVYIDLCPECAELFENFMCGADAPDDGRYVANLKDEIKCWEEDYEKLAKEHEDTYARYLDAKEDANNAAKIIDKMEKQIRELQKENDRLGAVYYALENGYKKVEKERDDAQDDIRNLESDLEWAQAQLRCYDHNDEETAAEIADIAKRRFMEDLKREDPEEVKAFLVDICNRALFGKAVHKSVDEFEEEDGENG